MILDFKHEARENLISISTYITQNFYVSGKKFTSKIIQCIYNLSIFPEMGSLISNQYYLRKLIYHNYIIIYQLNYISNAINIIKIFNSKQDINKILKHIRKYI